LISTRLAGLLRTHAGDGVKIFHISRNPLRRVFFCAMKVCSWPVSSIVVAGLDVRYGEAKPTFMLRCDKW
jgi:hypothetical protein